MKLGINEPVALEDFVERFIGHNTPISLADSNGDVEINEGETQHKIVWEGMDWQISYGPGDEEYFEKHPEVEKCPYSKCNVVKLGVNIDKLDDAVHLIFIDI